ncbi:hypothetical protein VHEMI07160 [[Torrubiella] hemipterigena]|uniref:Uncharacterized protein n=1 Tax=[Torrubiella] hemipterigena TaxID=1531966 RepID=A0A0A1TKU6_9HYPO|nr:hypothetical protein VHEMI07160 [[Torrubiella] hemipterigena]
MDSLVLSDAQKARLQKVANGMLQIYKTLARMRYLDPLWIVEGPHGIADDIDDYRSFDLEDSVIYLYSILPYLHPDFVGEIDFYAGGEFIDFRNTSCLGQSREPLDDEDENSCSGSDGESGNQGISNESEQDEDEYEDDEDDEDDQDDDEDEDDESPYSEDNSRPATAVLRDINQWFLELKALPGGGEYSSTLWDKTVTRPLYEKHGWPTDGFDGDAFLVDLVRHDARETSADDAAGPTKRLHQQQHTAKRYADPDWAYWEGRIDEETDIEGKWLARYHLFKKRRAQSITTRRIAFGLAKGYDKLEPSEAERLDGEVDKLMYLLWGEKSKLISVHSSILKCRQEGPEMRAARLRQKQVNRNIRIYTRAHTEAEAALEELGKVTATCGNGDGANSRTRDEAAAETAKKDKEDERQMERENAEESIAAAKAFLETIPPGIKHAREGAEGFIKSWEHMLWDRIE